MGADTRVKDKTDGSEDRKNKAGELIQVHWPINHVSLSDTRRASDLLTTGCPVWWHGRKSGKDSQDERHSNLTSVVTVKRRRSVVDGG